MDLFHQDDNDDQILSAYDDEPMTPSPMGPSGGVLIGSGGCGGGGGPGSGSLLLSGGSSIAGSSLSLSSAGFGPAGSGVGHFHPITYDQVVRDLIQEERQYLRDLHLIMKVFREQLATLNPPPTPAELDAIFSNIEEIYEVTVTLLGSLEDTLETVAEEAGGNQASGSASGGAGGNQAGQTSAVSSPTSTTSSSNSGAPTGSNGGTGLATVGCCFEELAEGAEFDVYDRYAKDVLSPACREALQAVLSRPDAAHALATGGHGFREAVRYYLPKLLVTPVYHCFTYFDAVRVLHRLSPSKEDRESLEQVEGLLKPLQVELERLLQSYSPSSFSLPKRKPSETGGLLLSGPLIRTGLLGGPRSSRPAALCKLQELQRSIEGWGDSGSGGGGGGGSSGSGGGGSGGSKEAGPACNEFICEGLIGKVGAGKRLTERYAFLFDGLLLLCKPNSSGHHGHHGHHRRSSAASGRDGGKDAPPEYRLKEKFFIRKVEILDREDTDELKNAFEVAPRQQPHCILFTRTAEEKANWMAALVMLNTKSMLERTLDVILLDEERKHPLRLPPPSLYRFAEEDSEANLVLETRENGGVPLIKGIVIFCVMA